MAGKGDNRRPTDEVRYGLQHSRALGDAHTAACADCCGVEWRFMQGAWRCKRCGAARDNQSPENKT